jgi:hypothetical protein
MAEVKAGEYLTKVGEDDAKTDGDEGFENSSHTPRTRSNRVTGGGATLFGIFDPVYRHF